MLHPHKAAFRWSVRLWMVYLYPALLTKRIPQHWITSHTDLYYLYFQPYSNAECMSLPTKPNIDTNESKEKKKHFK